MNPLLLSGLLVGALAAAVPLLVRLTSVRWLRLGAVPLATVLFAASFTLAGNGPLLRPLLSTLAAAESTPISGARAVPSAARPAAAPAPFDLQLRLTSGLRPEGPMSGLTFGVYGPPPPGERIRSVQAMDGHVKFMVPGGHRLHRPVRHLRGAI